MRYFDLMNFQHVMLYLFPALIFLIVFALFQAYAHLRSPDAEERKTRIIKEFPEGIQDRDAPFPLAMILVIVGTLVWAFLYIWFYGTMGGKI